MSTVIVFASKYGFTKECAQKVADGLNGEVDIIDLGSTKQVDLSAYDRVIIGGSVYVGKIRKEVSVFCTENLDVLKEKNLGLFICGMQEESVLKQELADNFPQELIDEAKSKQYLGGMFNFDKAGFLDKAIMKKIGKTTSNSTVFYQENLDAFIREMNASAE